jgi:hypothetical protein
MKNKQFTLVMLVFVACAFTLLLSFTKVEEAEYTPVENATLTQGKLWDGYTSWYKITKDAPNTGDPTGFIDKRHNGTKAFREIYINDIGEAVNLGPAPYKYPEGTIVVKESYKSKAVWEKKGKKVLTIMIKQAEGSSPETGDWGFVMGAKGKLSTGTSKWAKFCSGCHVYAANKDYVFMSSDFMKTLK